MEQTRIDEAKGALEGAISAQFPEGSTEFVNKFVSKYQVKPSASADTAYDSLSALKMAIEQSQSFEATNVAKSLLNVQFQGASGKIKFDPQGGIIRQPVLVKVLKSQIVLIE